MTIRWIALYWAQARCEEQTLKRIAATSRISGRGSTVVPIKRRLLPIVIVLAVLLIALTIVTSGQ